MAKTTGDRALEVLLTTLLPAAGAGTLAVFCWLLGPRFVPGVVAVVFVVLGSAMAAGLRLRFARLSHDDRESVQQARRAQRWRQLGLSLGALVLLAATAWYGAPRPLTSLPREVLHAAFVQDARLLDQHRRGMEMVLSRLERLNVPPPEGPLGEDGERVLLDSWRAFSSYATALEGLRRFHEDYYRFDLAGRRVDHVTGFLLTFTADAALYEKAARFTQLVVASPDAHKFLDNPHVDLPAGSFSRFREELLGSRNRARIEAGVRYLDVIEQLDVQELAPLRDRLAGWLEQHVLAVHGLGNVSTAEMTYRAELQTFKRALSRGWYPVQRKAAEVIGDTRVRRIGRYLIHEALRERVDEMLAPGDILVSRKNWYLSNVGLPGFWPHAMLYLGAPDKLADALDRTDVLGWMRAEGIQGESFTKALERRFPEAWAHYVAKDEGEPHRVIEAISEGVVMSTLTHCAGDYLAALRPRVDRVVKARAVWRAFESFALPYDFDFDFATDNAVVCTELVWRAYRPGGRALGRKEGLEFGLQKIAGRTTLPAHGIVAQYAAEAGQPDAQLDFVAFVDAREKQGQAFLSTEAALRGTVHRSQYDVFQK
jgi:Permuted papain-like amidase enzyme, YaeF/YiiX, C92 family